MTTPALTEAICHDCLSLFDCAPDPGRVQCPSCDSGRITRHNELSNLTIAHIDCDAFYASVEKRDRPELAAKPVIIGGASNRSVVSTACYVARMSGVRSAMPMFKARKLCADAVILSPDMAKYKAVSRSIRAHFDALTPLVEPLSLDEAFLDLTGTETLHGCSPAEALAEVQNRIEREIGVTVSVGLAPNKFLAKLASDMNKPRGFTVIGTQDAPATLAPLPISAIFGIGKAATANLKAHGLTHIHQLQGMDEITLMRLFGETGQRLWRLARGIDNRPVKAERKAKSVSAETTFSRDLVLQEDLEAALWRQAVRTADDAKAKNLAGLTVTLKLKTSLHKTITRSKTLDTPTQLADTLFETARALLGPLVGQTTYRLIGVGLSHFRPVSECNPADLVAPERAKRAKAEAAMDSLRARFGKESVAKGRGLKGLPGKNDRSAK